MNEPPTSAGQQIGPMRLILVLAFIYAFSGRVALLLALPPSYASAVFPPAGIALAFVLVHGWRMLPGVFLGALLLNAWLGLSRGPLTGTDLAAAAAIAIGSTAQAIAGAWTYRRLVHDGVRLDSFRALAVSLLCAPLICLTSATLSLAGLFLAGVEAPQAIATDWLTWWLGDTLGVVLCVPLTLLLIGRPLSLWKRRRLSVGLPVLIGVGLCVAIYLKATDWEQAQSLKEFQLATERVADEIQTHLAGQEFVVEELSAFMSHTNQGDVSRDEFQRFASATLAKTSEVAALEWVPCVTDAQRAGFEARHAEAMTGFRITERGPDGALVPSAHRARYFPVAYVEPLQGNRRALGFDLASDAVRNAAISQSLRSGSAVATAPIELVQDQQKQKGLILVQVVHAQAECPDLVLSVLRLEDFVRKSLPDEAATLELRVEDASTHVTVFGRQPLQPPGDQLFHQLQFGGRTFSLVSTPTKAYLARHRSWQSLTLLAGCLFGTSLLGALLLLSTGYAERTEMLVRERTAQLEQEIRKTALFLRNASDGTHIIDYHGRIVEASDSFCRMLGYSRHEVIGMRVSDWDANVRSEDVEAAVRMRFESEQAATFEATHRRKDGSTFDVEVSICPIEQEGARFLFASSRDVTERKIAEKALRLSESRLQSITDRIPMRVSFIDARERYRFVNPAYESAFGKLRAELYGMTVREVLGDGAYSQVEPYIARALAGETLTFDSEITTLEGYRCYRASYVPQFAEDGGTVLGFVAIIFDMTTQKLEERRLIELSQLDSLTGLLNRAGFQQRGTEALERCRASKGLMAMMALDIDGFKQVNDTMGHMVGDMMLKGFAGRLVKTLRANDIVARPGGDEFSVIVEGLSGLGDASRIARNIVEIMRTPFILEDRTLAITTSIGVAIYAGHADITGRDLIQLADELLYEVKRAGRNDFRVGVADSKVDLADPH